MSLLGIDVGTSGCKTAVFSERGALLSLAYEEYDFQHPQPGWAELDTPTVWAQVKHTIRKAAAGAGGDPVRGVCVSSMGEAVVPVTANREILGPSLLNFDARGDEYLPELGSLMTAERLYRDQREHPGQPLHPDQAEMDSSKPARPLPQGRPVPALERVRFLYARGRTPR